MRNFLRLGLRDTGNSDASDASDRQNRPKRLSPRYAGPFPASVYDGVRALPDDVVVRDINERGLYFWSHNRPAIGAGLAVIMEPPPQMTQFEQRRVLYRASVVRVEDAPENRFGIAAIIKSCTLA